MESLSPAVNDSATLVEELEDLDRMGSEFDNMVTSDVNQKKAVLAGISKDHKRFEQNMSQMGKWYQNSEDKVATVLNEDSDSDSESSSFTTCPSEQAVTTSEGNAPIAQTVPQIGSTEQRLLHCRRKYDLVALHREIQELRRGQERMERSMEAAREERGRLLAGLSEGKDAILAMLKALSRSLKLSVSQAFGVD